MTEAGASGTTRALAVRGSRELSDSSAKRRSVRSGPSKQWQPPEGLSARGRPGRHRAAAQRARSASATGSVGDWCAHQRGPRPAARWMCVATALFCRTSRIPVDRPSACFSPPGQADLPGALLLWAKEHGFADDEPAVLLAQTRRGWCAAADKSSAGAGKSSVPPQNGPMYASSRCGLGLRPGR